MAESEEELKSLLMRLKGVKEESENAGLNINIKKKKTKIVPSSPITSWQIEGEKVEMVTDVTFLGSKITAMVTAAMKLKEFCSLEGKLVST